MDDLLAFWNRSSWTNDNRTHSPDNVWIEDSVLVLKLSGSQPGELPVCAEITSKRSDFHYGSYSASIKTTDKAGAVVGWFVYLGSPLNEIDIEFLTQDITHVHFTLHHIDVGVDYDKVPIDFDPSTGFHEYRFDWYADRVEYFIDGEHLSTLTNRVPDLPCKIMLNHWSGNIPGWGGPAPQEDVFMYVDWMRYSTDVAAVDEVKHAGNNEWVTIKNNPHSLVIQLDKKTGHHVRGELLRLNGQRVVPFSGPDNEGRCILEKKVLNNGVYIVRIESDNKSFYKRLILAD